MTDFQIPENDFTRLQKVTIRRLLAHTAGMPAYDHDGYGPNDQIPTIQEILKGEAPAKNPAVQPVYTPGKIHCGCFHT